MKNTPQLLLFGAVVWLVISVILIFSGQPDVDRLYSLRATEYDQQLTERKVFVPPAEVLSYMYKNEVELRIIDVRSESDYNLFHLKDAENTSLNQLSTWSRKRDKPNRLIIVTSNDEAQATLAWKRLTAMKVANVYILEGGVNAWLKAFGDRRSVTDSPGNAHPNPEAETLRYVFRIAQGDNHIMARPSKKVLAQHKFEKRVKLKTKARKGGGCG